MDQWGLFHCSILPAGLPEVNGVGAESATPPVRCDLLMEEWSGPLSPPLWAWLCVWRWHFTMALKGTQTAQILPPSLKKGWREEKRHMVWVSLQQNIMMGCPLYFRKSSVWMERWMCGFPFVQSGTPTRDLAWRRRVFLHICISKLGNPNISGWKEVCGHRSLKNHWWLLLFSFIMRNEPRPFLFHPQRGYAWMEPLERTVVLFSGLNLACSDALFCWELNSRRISLSQHGFLSFFFRNKALDAKALQ